MVFLEMDLSGAEWHVVAYLANDPKMLEISKSGQSPHGITAQLISKAPLDMILAEDKLLGHATDPDTIENERKNISGLLEGDFFLPRTMTMRQAGKKANHGLNYGMGYRRFGEDNEMPETDAKRIHYLYSNEAYPGIRKWWASIQEELRTKRTLTNCFGRKVHLREEWGSRLFDKAYSFKPQSTVVDSVNQAMRLAYFDERPEFKPMRLGAQVHDSLLNIYPDDNPRQMLDFMFSMREHMRPELEYNDHKFRLSVDIKVGKRWADMRDFNPDHKDALYVLGNLLQELRAQE